MSNQDLTATTFDYSCVDDDQKSKLIWLAAEVNKQKSSGLTAILEMGKAIAEAQELLADHKDGVFGQWIELSCGFGRKTAYNYLHAYQRFNGCVSLTQLNAEAMYVLSAPTAPKGAADKAMKLAASGVKITAKVAKGLVTPPVKKPAETSTEADPEPEPPQSPTATVAPPPKPTPPADLEDEVGQKIPAKLRDIFEAALDFEQHARSLGALKKWTEGMEGQPAARYFDAQAVLGAIRKLKSGLRLQKPYAVCPYCQAAKPKCEACKGSGFVTKILYDSAPAEFRM